MSIKSSISLEPLVIEFRPSRWLRLMAGAAALAVGMAILGNGLPWPIRILLLATAAVYLLAFASRQTGWPGPAAWRTLRWSEGSWLLQDRRGQWLPVTLTDSVVWPGVVALQLRGPGNRALRLLLATDAMGPQQGRRLRLHLRCLPVFGP